MSQKRSVCFYEKRPDGRYGKQAFVGYKPNGNRIMKTVYGKTIKEVEKKEREIRNMIDSGIQVTQSYRILLKDWARQWLKTYKAGVEYNTYRMYESAIEIHIIPALGAVEIPDLKTIQMQQFINELMQQGLERTAQICQLTLKQMIGQAVSERIIPYNMCDGLQLIRIKRSEKRTLTDFEKESIHKANLTQRERVFIDIMHYAVLRRGEALGLRVTDVNLKAGTITVDKSLCFIEYTASIKTPKTKASYRTIPMPEIL